MYNVLIVDDFEVDRSKVKKIIETHSELQIRIIGECETGIQALNYIESIRPDIVISDIEMPYMNGLDMAKNIKEKYGNSVKIIFCTLYDEFKYAKEAIYSNSYGYVLKPIQENELLDCINVVVGDISKEVQFLNEYKNLKNIFEGLKPILIDNFLKETIYGANICENDMWEKVDYFGIKLARGFLRVLYMEIDDYEIITANQKIEQKQLFAVRIFEKIKTITNEYWGFPVTRIDETHFVIITSWNELETARENSCDCVKKIMETLKRIDVSITTALSDFSTKLGDIRELFEQCRFIMRYKFTIGKGEAISSEDIPSNTGAFSIDINLLQKDIRYLLNSGSKDDILQYIDRQVGNLSVKTDSNALRNFCFLIVVCIRFVLNENNINFDEIASNEIVVWEKLLKFETILDAGNWVKNMLIFANEHISKKSGNKNAVIVDEIKKYIINNINRNIGLDDLASEMHYSPNYLNYVFKQITGYTINDYITTHKIEKAKELLGDVRNKVQDVSETLGYSHAAYFCSVFKKITGMTPKEYREKAV